MPITWERMFPTGGWKPNKPHNVKSVATSNIAVLENEEENNTEKKSRFGETATLELSNNYFREKSSNNAAMLMESKAVVRTLKVGSRGDDVKRLQENLNTLGFNTGKPDGIFGNGTKKAVIAFQRAKGLTADGIVGNGTQNAITRALNEKNSADNSNILKVGSKGAKVTQLQSNLNSLGYNAGKPDGDFGTGTKNAVISFQKTFGLSADGVAGKATQDAIATTISRKSKGILSKGQVSNDVRNLQNDLKTLGYLASNADGAFGTGTEAAVKAFQKNHKLTQDGLVGASTRSKISAAVNEKNSKPKTNTNTVNNQPNDVKSNTVTKNGIEFTRKQEGCVLELYNNGQTIGYGMDIANYPDVTVNYSEKGKITQEEADRLFEIVYRKKADGLREYIDKNNYKLDQYQFASAMDLVYNRGINDMTKAVIDAMGKKDNDKVENLLMDDFDYKYAMKYIYNNNSDKSRAYVNRNPGLKKRREREVKMANDKTYSV